MISCDDKKKKKRGKKRYMFGGRKTKSAKSAVTPYELGSLESKIRQASDFALLMQDYDTAASNYRIAKQDYHNDRKQSLLASANEMHGNVV
eukprot:jgi/Bigna1/133990/aug1.23_g8698